MVTTIFMVSTPSVLLLNHFLSHLFFNVFIMSLHISHATFCECNFCGHTFCDYTFCGHIFFLTCIFSIQYFLDILSISHFFYMLYNMTAFCTKWILFFYFLFFISPLTAYYCQLVPLQLIIF